MRRSRARVISYIIAVMVPPQLTRDYFRSDGLSLPGAMEFGSMEAVKELLKAGLGVSILGPVVGAQGVG